MKKISLLLVLAMMLSVLAACGGSGGNSGTSASEQTDEAEVVDNAAESDDDEAQENSFSKDTLVMATEAGFKPYEYYDDSNNVVGVDVDIAKEIAAAIGAELVVENMEFGAIIPAVQSGKADFGAAGISITPDRAEVVDFTIEYATSKQVILTVADSEIMNEDDLDGKVVGVQMGTVADLVLSDDYPEVSVQKYNKYFEATNDLLAGRIDAIVLDSLPAVENAQMDESLVIRDEELFTDVYAFCVRKDNEELLNAINQVMQQLLDEGKIEAFTAEHSAD